MCGSGNTLATASLMAGALSEKMTRGGHPEAVLEALAAPGHGVCRLVQEQAAGQHLGGAGFCGQTIVGLEQYVDAFKPVSGAMPLLQM